MTILQALKSKTVQFSILLTVLSILQGYIGFIPSQVGQAVAGSCIAACIVVLRVVTTHPISAK